jgi:UDP-N-acetylmuramoyl-L-alanyl-D-glutamate--2,6-diaminopimelate ligase
MLRKLKNLLWHLPKSIYWNIVYGFPHRSLVLIGVTGTDGKTTTSTLLQKILENSGKKTAIISTINSPGLHTTSPDPKILMELFSNFKKDHFTHVVCEVTSHALDQYRFWGCHFEVGVLTNISHEHLDYHHTLDNYIKAKSILFHQSKIAILNRDDPYYSDIKKYIHIPQLAYSLKNESDLKATKIDLNLKGISFQINNQDFFTDSPYQYQLYNILAATLCADQLKINREIVKKTIKHFPETKGRREIIKNELQLNTIIDFAHTPNALKETLSSLAQVSQGKIICLFGATGGRDKSKRPLMGQIVSEYADIGIITADDTRQEDINDINNQIISGINQERLKQKKFFYYNIPNRQDAFNMAVKIAKPQDTIIACGKGHENTILHGKTEYPWSESEAFRTAFRILKENV